VTVSAARLLLFLIWLGVWLLYVLLFFSATVAKKGVIFQQAADASWQVTYVLLPIITAFASYWFVTEPNASPAGTAAPPPDSAVIDRARVVAMFSITLVVNVIVGIYFLFGALLPDFDAPDSTSTFSGGVEAGVKMLVVLASLVGLPVGFLLGKRPAPPAPGGIHSQAGGN
jgi:hypothetical protein